MLKLPVLLLPLLLLATVLDGAAAAAAAGVGCCGAVGAFLHLSTALRTYLCSFDQGDPGPISRAHPAKHTHRK